MADHVAAVGVQVVVALLLAQRADEAVERESKRCGMYYVNTRWLGGTLTNWNTIRQSINKLQGGVVGTLMSNFGMELALRYLHYYIEVGHETRSYRLKKGADPSMRR